MLFGSVSMRSISSALCLAVLGLVLAGCQTTNPETRQASDQWRMMSLEENFLEFKEARQAEINRARQTEAMLKERMMALEEQMAALRTELAEAESAPVMKGPESGEEKPWAEPPAPVVKDTPKMAAKPAPKPRPAPRRAAPVATSAETALYEKGQGLAAEEQPVRARNVLDEFMKKYPSSKLMPNAVYWMGETYYAEKNYPQAILTFKDVTRRWPDHPKAQAALLKIGMSYKNSGDRDNAVFYLRTLVDEHPGSRPAELARSVLREIPE